MGRIFGWEIFAAVAATLLPIREILWTMIFLISVDFVTGIVAALKTGDSIKSKKMYSTASKFLVYCLVIMSAHFIQTHIVDEIPWTKLVAALIALIEFKSILENFNKIYGIDMWRQLLEFFKRKDFTDILPKANPKKEEE